MTHTFTKSFQATRWLTIFICLHVFFWTLIPAWIRYTLPMDAMEGTTWGHQLVLGYDKNPFLNAWLTRFALFLGGGYVWVIYLFSQLSVAACFWAVWQLGKKWLPPIYALIAVMLLESMQYYNLHAIDFNDNTLELGLWALTMLYFYQASLKNTLSDWLLTGFFAALGMMAKYYTVMLLIPMLLFMLVDKTARQRFKSPFLYAGVLIFILIILPHTVWLFSHDFITIQYALGRVSSPPTLFNHLQFPLQFTWQQLEVLLPALLLFSILLSGKKPLLTTRPTLTHFDKTFLLFMALGPFLMTVLLSAIFGMKLRAGWGQPLLSLSGILLITWITPHVTRERFIAFIAFLIVLSTVMISVYSIALIRANKPSSANFPGEIIARELTVLWEKRYHKPLMYVAGPRWIAGNIAFYSKDQPAVYMDWDNTVSSWIDENKVRTEGAIFVWDPTEAVQVSEKDVRKRFPQLGPLEILHFSWMRNKKMAPVEIRVAFLPPG